MFLAKAFAIAGLIAAAGPILIHLLNRQRFRVVEWAAMDFLRQAVRRSRRILRLRDLLLLVLRTACVLLFGLAMARPYLTASATAADADQPVHAVLVVDNSLSMSVEQLNKPLLDDAKAKAKDFIHRLPPGSRISILPLCGSTQDYNLGAYSTKEDALEALAAIQPVDRLGKAADAISQAVECCARVPSPTSKQVIFLSDQQAVSWPSQSLEAHFKQLRSPLEVVQISPKDSENAWIGDFRLQDGIADPATPAVFLATVRYDGLKPRPDVQVALAVEGVTIATQTVDLEPGQTREVRFPPYQFEVKPEPGEPAFVAAEVSIPHDALAADDQRVLLAPVVASLPVVFIDQLGSEEDPQRNRFGETFRLRRLLAPVTERQGSAHHLVKIEHRKIDQIDQELLSTARMVVVAGVANPEGKVPLLRQYVEQGGRLLIAAGGEFDPAAWNDAAWLNGQGILPAPLRPVSLGRLPGVSSGPLSPFQLDFVSLEHHPYFAIEQTPREELEELYRLPYFFMAVEADTSDEAMAQLSQKVAEQVARDRAALGDLDQRLAALTEKEIKSGLSEAERRQRAQLDETRRGLRPQWLAWAKGRPSENLEAMPVDKRVQRSRPRVLARFTNRAPYLVERTIGQGEVLLVTSGVFRDWNTMTATNTVLVFDRILREMLEASLPRRNLGTSDRLVLPVEAGQHRARFTLTDPAGRESPLSVDAIGADRYGLSLPALPLRGLWRITAQATKETSESSPDAKLWVLPLAVNGPAEESELRALDEKALAERMGSSGYRWVAAGQSIQLSAVPLEGRDLWEWLLMAVVVGLLLEMAFLALPGVGRERAA